MTSSFSPNYDVTVSKEQQVCPSPNQLHQARTVVHICIMSIVLKSGTYIAVCGGGSGGGDQLLWDRRISSPNDLRAGRPVLAKFHTRKPKFHLCNVVFRILAVKYVWCLSQTIDGSTVFMGCSVIGIKICCWALVQIYSRDIGACCQSWGRQGRSFVTDTLGEAIHLHQCSVADFNGYYSAFEW